MAVTGGHGRRRRPPDGRGWGTTAALGLGILLVVVGIVVIARDELSQHAYRRLSGRVSEASDAEGAGDASPLGEGAPGIDWDELWDQNADVAAWVRVDGTDIDLPVVAPSDGDMTWYLHHDLWGQWSLSGVPFLDHRSSPDGAHRLAYGHHLYMGGQFSDLQRAYRQEVFDGIGPCHWHTPARGEAVLAPLCAMTVDMWYGEVQEFAFAGPDGMEQWLRRLVGDADAVATDAEGLVRRARSAVTLVTCSSDLSNQSTRTLVVFVDA